MEQEKRIFHVSLHTPSRKLSNRTRRYLKNKSVFKALNRVKKILATLPKETIE